MADGNLDFDVRLNTDGFEKGISNIDKTMLDMKKTVMNVAKSTHDAFDGKNQKNIETLSQRLLRQMEAMERAKRATDKLKKSYEEMSKQDVTPKGLDKIEKEMAKILKQKEEELELNLRLEKSYNQAYAAIETLSSGDTQLQPIGDSFVSSINLAKEMAEKLGTELEESADKIVGLDEQAKRLGVSIQEIKMNPEGAQKAEELASKLEMAEQKLARLAYEASITDTNLKSALDETQPEKWKESIEGSTKSVKKLGTTAKKTSNEFSKMMKPIEKIATRLKRMVAAVLVWQVIRGALKGVSDHMQMVLGSNEQLSNSLKLIKVNLMTAFQPIITAIMPALNMLMDGLAKATAYMAQFISMLFGTSYEASRAAAEASYDQANALEAVGKSAKKAQKTMQGFDKLNKQQDTSGKEAGGEGGSNNHFVGTKMPDLNPVWAEKFFTALSKIKKALGPTIDSLKNLYEKGLKPLGRFVWQGALDFWDYFLVPVGGWVLGEGLPRLVDAIAITLASIDWDMLNGSLVTLWEALAPFAIIIGEGLLWFLEVVLLPMVEWAMNNVVPAAIDLISAAIELLGELIKGAMPAIEWFWETFLVPIRDFAWTIISKFIDGFVKAFRAFSDWAKANPQTIETIAKIVLTFLAGLWVYNTTKNLISFLLKLGDIFVGLSGKMASLMIANLPAAAILALAAAFVIIGGMWDKLSGASRVATILGGLAAAAVAAAIAIAVFHTSWTVGIAAAAIVGSIAAIGIAFAALKKQTGEGWSVATPNINPFGAAGGGDADGFMASLGKGSPLPMLAQGGLIPPRKPRAVIVGDNTVEDEIISPRSAIREEVKNAISELGGTWNGGADHQIFNMLNKILKAIESGKIIEMNGREFGRTVYRTMENIKGRTGHYIG